MAKRTYSWSAQVRNVAGVEATISGSTAASSPGEVRERLNVLYNTATCDLLRLTVDDGHCLLTYGAGNFTKAAPPSAPVLPAPWRLADTGATSPVTPAEKPGNFVRTKEK